MQLTLETITQSRRSKRLLVAARRSLSNSSLRVGSFFRFRSVGLGRSQAVDATDAGDDHAIAALEEALGGGEAELVQLVVDGGVLFDVPICRPRAIPGRRCN